MSGPKVVRIVTREEIEAICRRHLASVREAVEELRRCARRHDALDDQLTAALEQRLQALQRLFDEEQWVELQKQAPQAVAFLHHEAQQVRTRATAAAEATRSKRRRIADAARTLASAIEASGGQPVAALRDVITRAGSADERELATMQTVLNVSYATLSAAREQSEMSSAQRELAARLGVGETGQAFPEWLAKHVATIDQRDARLDRLMAEIETLDDPETAKPYLERASAIASELSIARRALLTDSLALDLSERSRRRRQDAMRAGKLREARAGLQAVDASEARMIEALITTMLNSADLGRADELITRAEKLIEYETAKMAATARRRAVLGGLAKLGYEVRETMATAWANDGRLVLRKPNANDYGIELGAPSDASRLQVRLVGSNRPSSPRDARRDRDMETIWCSEFGRLRELLATQGDEVVIERAIEAGEQAVKTVALLGSEREVRQVVRHVRTSE